MSIRCSRIALSLGMMAFVVTLTDHSMSSGQEKKKDLHQVTLFEDNDFGGRAIVLHKDHPELAKREFNDLTSSMKWNLPPGTSIVLYTDNNFESPAIVLIGRGELKNFDSFPDAHDAISSVAFLPVGKNGYPKGIVKKLPRLGAE